MSPRLQNKKTLITGSTSNIGRAIAFAFAAEGAHVIVSGRDRERGEAVVAQIREAGGRADYVYADLDGTAAASSALAAAAADRLGGRIDILVNNAGIYPPGTTLTIDDESFDRVYAVNVKAPFFLTQAVVPGMLDAGSGVIINLGSWVARLGIPVGALYSSTKGAMETLTRAWSSEFGNRGVRVNAISPGVIVTPDWDSTTDHPGESLMHGTPVGRSGHPDAIAAAAVYLASDDAAFIHGTVLDVDGGRTGVAVLANRMTA
ncbi:SDR family oxidoreductase [Kribbella sp. NBC_01245]|uniref:SDR family NAD(P)-dependent oxidoreductase n=1 Tax=Kribbella sp. NBC_01245 TaxID=2903578 RepID=UPI002E29C411|nr:SDR family oxidoreductase [Kribbella sp. NBC_01245]